MSADCFMSSVGDNMLVVSYVVSDTSPLLSSQIGIPMIAILMKRPAGAFSRIVASACAIVALGTSAAATFMLPGSKPAASSSRRRVHFDSMALPENRLGLKPAYGSANCVPPSRHGNRLNLRPIHTSIHRSSSVALDDIGSEPLSEERRAKLFQFLLRDLQVEGVPLLEVEVSNNAYALQAAVWTIFAELFQSEEGDDSAETENGHKAAACLILPGMSIDILRNFVTDFEAWQREHWLLAEIPELACLRVSLVGKGLGSALVLKVLPNVSGSSTTAVGTTLSAANERRYLQGMANFATIVQSMASPLQQQEERMADGTLAFRCCPHHNIFSVLSTYWNCVCQLVSDSKMQDLVLLLHDAAPETCSTSRFVAMTFLLRAGLSEESRVNLAYYHPDFALKGMKYAVDKWNLAARLDLTPSGVSAGSQKSGSLGPIIVLSR
jgi:hypothetical protein